jgi:hypothetical protein
MLTSSVNSETFGERQGCDEASGRRRRGSGYAKAAPVSADSTHQGGRGHTEGVSRAADSKAKLTVALDGARRDGSHGTDSGRWRAVAGLPARVGRVRERASWAEGANKRGEVGEHGAAARTWLENTQSWARPRRGDCGRKVEDD